MTQVHEVAVPEIGSKEALSVAEILVKAGDLVNEKELRRVEAIILAMTPGERRNPDIIKGSRKERIAKGSGTSTQQVSALLKNFQQMQRVMKQFGGKSKGRMPDPRELMRRLR